VKGISIYLAGNLSELESNPTEKDAFITDVKIKLGLVHNVNPNEIVILGLMPGSKNVPYLLPSGSPSVTDIEAKYQQVFGENYLKHEIHPSFTQLNINPGTFSPQWNANFGDPNRCPVGEKRGGFPYNPPAGWLRFGLNVAGKFQGGDTWLGMRNCPGEWAVVYHGTKVQFVKAITETPLKPGIGDAYGYGIYCTPNPDIPITDGYASPTSLNINGQTISVRFMFMCRVNVSSVHHCTAAGECPLAKDPMYTLHISTYKDYWFVNCQNQGYQNIRPYGLLVKEGP
jgi:hypothetical protein